MKAQSMPATHKDGACRVVARIVVRSRQRVGYRVVKLVELHDALERDNKAE